MYTLTIVFNKDKDKLLMITHQKLNCLNYVGGKMESYEVPIEASYRELYEETGISKDDITLKFLRQERTITSVDDGQNWELYITAGVLNKDVMLRLEKNQLFWLDRNDWVSLINAYGNGNCLTYYIEACKIFNIEVGKCRIVTENETAKLHFDDDVIRDAETVEVYNELRNDILVRYVDYPSAPLQNLANAKPSCKHKIQAQFAGIRCLKCGGWWYD